MRALVLDACGLRGALVGVRGLTAAGWDVGVAASCAPGLAGSSRGCTRRHHVPPAPDDPDGFLEALARITPAYDALLPAGDAELMAVSQHRDRFETCIPYPSHEVVVESLDKELLSARARELGIAVPRTVDEAELTSGRAPLPLMVKQRWSGVQRHERWETIRAVTHEDAAAHVSSMRAAGLRPMLQEVVEGDLLALSLLLDRDGSVVAAVQSVGDPRTWPPVTGMRVRSRTTRVDPELLEQVRRLLADAGWWGLADVDFLAPAAGPPRLIDCNGRLYGSMAIAAAAGVNFPDLWARTALGHEVPHGLLGRPGVRFHWLEGDLRRALSPAGRLRDIPSALRFAVGAAHSTGQLRDPVPGLRRIATLAAGAADRVVRRRPSPPGMP